MERFTIDKHEDAFFVKDNEASSYHSPTMASPIYFKNPHRPQQICNILNAEWLEFLAKPE